MTKYLQKRFLLSEEGAENMKKGILFSVLMNISFLLPMALVYFFVKETISIYISETQNAYTIWLYLLLAPLILAAIYWASLMQYDSVYTSTYTETAKKRIALAEHIRRLPLSFFGKRDLADLTATIMTDIEKLEHAYSHSVPQFYGTILSSSLIALALSAVNWKMALALFLPFPLALLMIHLARKKKVQQETSHNEKKLKVTEAIQEILENVPDIKAFGRKERTLTQLGERLNAEEKQHIRTEMYNPLLIAPISSFLRLGVLASILVGVYEHISGRLPLADYLTMVLAAAIFYTPMDACLSFIVEFMYVQVPADRMNEIFCTPLLSGAEAEISRADIELENVSFAYEDQAVIHDVSFRVAQGETTALVGPSGCGKSTLARLMLRFWDVSSGKITLGGKDIREIEPESLLKNYSVVFQDVVLFHNSILENIRIGRKNASDEEVIAAAKIAQVDEFAAKLPQGYNTMIGENGVLLSGGERQRISIARAILKDAPVIVLDESTASMDADNETRLQKALSELIKNKTVLIIAHRLRTVEKADKIIVLDKGQVMESGRADELLARRGAFYRLWQLQQGGDK